MEYGNKLNPEHSLRKAGGIKGTKQKIIITHNPSEIDQNQLLLVRFSNLGSGNVIVPGIANLSFNIKLDSTDDKNRTLVSNIGRAIVTNCYKVIQGIIHSGGCIENCIELRIDAKDKSGSNARDNAIANTYGTSSLFPSTLKC